MWTKDDFTDAELDATHEELEEMGSDVVEELVCGEEFEERRDEIHDLVEVQMGSAIINRMFGENDITFGQYLELIEIVEQYEQELERTVL